MLKTRIYPKTMIESDFRNSIVDRPKNLFQQNSKLKPDNIYNFSIPAYKAIVNVSGEYQEIKTCPNAGKCLNFCYASSGNYFFSNVIIAHHRNLNFVMNSPKEFIQTAIEEIQKRKIKILRIHDSGDFFSENYLNLWLEIIKENPMVQFYAYTKNIPLFRKFQKEIPKNFTYIFSFGGTKDSEIDLKKDRHAKIFNSLETLKENNYQNVSKSDLKASMKRFRKVGLVIHGGHRIKKNTKGQIVIA